jgi:hypothetical protein
LGVKIAPAGAWRTGSVVTAGEDVSVAWIVCHRHAILRGAWRPKKERAMIDGYLEVPVTSRAAEAELDRQRARRLAASRAGASAERGDAETQNGGREVPSPASGSTDARPGAIPGEA